MEISKFLILRHLEYYEMFEGHFCADIRLNGPTEI
jgi:hypothetical protein